MYNGEMKITIAQINTKVGDFAHNRKKILAAIKTAQQNDSDIILFPECATTGYPPQDLLCREEIITQSHDLIHELTSIKKCPDILIGTPWKESGKLYNAAILIESGKIKHIQKKCKLPNNDIFDELRYFIPENKQVIVPYKHEKLGIIICEDLWHEAPVENLVNQGATLIINLSASPFEHGKIEKRIQLIESHIQKHKVPFIFVNTIGANDSIIFDGTSLTMNNQGQIIDRFPSFEESVATLNLTHFPRHPEHVSELQPDYSQIQSALQLGIKDYFQKTGFQKATIGVSGGIDSAIVAALATNALGPNNITAIAMPGPYSSDHSLKDAQTLAQNLGITLKTIPITALYNQAKAQLESAMSAPLKPLTDQNLQARLRGNILMAQTNQEDALVLATGNKSELAMGYCTQYGDLIGALAPISDLYKTQVYKLAHHLNKAQEIIPNSTLEKPPSAELAPNQTDQDTLPDYEILDKILEAYIEENKPIEEIPQPEAASIIKRLHQNEFKRHQMPPGLRLSKKAFGVGRRLLIT